jgi:hypothetical protein
MPQYTYARRRSRPSEAYSRLLLASTKRRKRLRLVSSSSDSASHLRRRMIGSHEPWGTAIAGPIYRP